MLLALSSKTNGAAAGGLRTSIRVHIVSDRYNNIKKKVRKIPTPVGRLARSYTCVSLKNRLLKQLIRQFKNPSYKRCVLSTRPIWYMVTMGASIIPLEYQLSSDSGRNWYVCTHSHRHGALVRWKDPCVSTVVGRSKSCFRHRRFKRIPRNNARGPFKFVLTVVFANYALDKNTH